MAFFSFQINYNFCLNFLKFFFPPLFRANTFWKLFKIPRFLLLALGNETNISNCDKRSTDQNERNDGNTIFFLFFFFFYLISSFFRKMLFEWKPRRVCAHMKKTRGHIDPSRSWPRDRHISALNRCPPLPLCHAPRMNSIRFQRKV